MSDYSRRCRKGQVFIEFTFSFMILLLLLYGAIMAFRWAGVSLAERRIAHDNTLTTGIDERWIDANDGPLKQVKSDFYTLSPMNLIFNKW